MSNYIANQGHGSIRKSKAFGAVGVISLSAALLLSAHQTVSAEEIASSSSPAITEVAAQSTEAPVSDTNVATTAETEIVVDVSAPSELTQAISTAEQAGVAVTEAEPVVYETKAEAGADYSAQVENIQKATEEQNAQDVAYQQEVATYEEDIAEQAEIKQQYEDDVKAYNEQVKVNKENELKNKELKEAYDAAVEKALTPVEKALTPVADSEKVAPITELPKNEVTYNGDDKITVIADNSDVKNNIVLIESNGQYGLFDTGYVNSNQQYEKVANHLKEANITDLDFVFISHLDYDHVGGVSTLVGNKTRTLFDDFSIAKLYIKEPEDARNYRITPGFKVDGEAFYKHNLKVFNNILSLAQKNGTEVIIVDKNFNTSLGEFNINVLNTAKSKADEQDNYWNNLDSMVQLVSKTDANGNTYTMLVANDLEGYDIPETIEEIKSLGVSQIDTYVVNHHGFSSAQREANMIANTFGTPTALVTNTESTFAKSHSRLYNLVKETYTNGLYYNGSGSIQVDFSKTEDNGLVVLQANNANQTVIKHENGEVIRKQVTVEDIPTIKDLTTDKGNLEFNNQTGLANISAVNAKLGVAPARALTTYTEGNSDKELMAYFAHDDNQVRIYDASDLSNLSIFAETTEHFRDPSMIKIDDTYYITGTSAKAGERDFIIWSTKDFKTFEKTSYYTGLSDNNAAVWAPDFYVDAKNNEIHIYLSKQKTPTAYLADKSGESVRDFYIYDLTIDLKNKAILSSTKLNLDNGENKIDAHVFDYNDNPYMIVKDETNKELELWRKTANGEWEKLLEKIPNTPDWVEGPFVYEKDGVYNIVFDSYSKRNGLKEGIMYVTTTDFVNFSELKQISSDERLRHGSVLKTYKTNLPANQRNYSIPVTKNSYGRTVISIQTQKDLETFLNDDIIDERDYIEFKNTEDLVFPQRVYQVKKWADWYITPQSTGNINFNNSIFLIDSPIGMSIRTTGNHSKADGSNQVFKNMIVIGSANAVIEETDTVAAMKNTTGNFGFSAVKASNMTFENMKFYAAHAMSTHLFDLMGSSNIVFDGIQSYGYGIPGMTEEMLVKLNKDNSHRIFSEAIQFDAAYPGGAGEVANIEKEWNRQIWNLDMFDGAGSHDILITNSLFTNYTGPTGHSIMTGTNEESVYTYGATIGSHGMDAKIAPHFRNITVQNSQFDSTIYNPVSKDKVNYPIHFLLYKLTEEEVASLKSINNVFTNIRGTNYLNNGVAGTTAKWNGDSYLSFYAGEPIAEPDYLPIVKVEKPIKPNLPELVKPVKPTPVEVSYHLVKVKEKQPVTPIETPVKEEENPSNNGGTPALPVDPINPVEQETPVVNAQPENPSAPGVTQTENKEVKNSSTENSSNPAKQGTAANSTDKGEKTQQSQAERPKTPQNSSSNESSKKTEVTKNEVKSNAKPNTSSSASSTNKVDKKQTYSTTTKSKAKATNNNSIIAVIVFALTLIGSGLGFLFWKHFLKK